MEHKVMSTTMLASYSSILATSFISYMTIPALFGQADAAPVVDAIGAASDLKGPMLFAFLIVVLVLWSLNKMSTASSQSHEKVAAANSASQEKTALTNKEALQHVTTGFTTFKTELNTDIDGIKTKQDEHTKELGLQRNELTKLNERIPSTCKIKDV